ncbi:hypothetical protein K280104A7_27110 [Candidatus Bariatricus faecipullorum]
MIETDEKLRNAAKGIQRRQTEGIFMEQIKQNCRKLYYKYGHIWVFLYILIYMPWFMWLEQTVTTSYYVIHSPFDDYIPFCEYFVVPYLLWFPFIACTLLYFFFTDKKGFYQVSAYLFTGMTIFLIISTIFPNGLQLRPRVFERDNIFVAMVRLIYMADTPTNVLPSLHVYNSLAAFAALSSSGRFVTEHKKLHRFCLVLTVSIVLSTMFLKQHSVVDVIAGCVMAYIIYQFVYVPGTGKSPNLARQTT